MSDISARPQRGSLARFDTLDGLRGVAALGVVVFHLEGFATAGRLMAHGYLAVDFFFVVSGFVISHAYDHELERGAMDFREFASRRLKRLWPMQIFGLGLMLLVALARPLLGGSASPPVTLVAWTVFGALFLPNPLAGAGPIDCMFLNGPAWSLHFELMVNLIYAAFRRAFSDRALAVVIAAGFAGLVILGLSWGTIEGGSHFADYPLGLERVGFAFPLGIGLHRLHVAGVLPTLRTSPWLLAAVLLGCLCAPYCGRLQFLFDLFFVGVISPVLVTLALDAKAGARSRRVLRFAGDLSYPLYALHAAISAPVMLLALRLGASASLKAVIAAPLVIATILAAYGANRWVDTPIRAWLGGARRRAERRGCAKWEDIDYAGVTRCKATRV